jgi:hypothetical protein
MILRSLFSDLSWGSREKWLADVFWLRITGRANQSLLKSSCRTKPRHAESTLPTSGVLTSDQSTAKAVFFKLGLTKIWRGRVSKPHNPASIRRLYGANQVILLYVLPVKGTWDCFKCCISKIDSWLFSCLYNDSCRCTVASGVFWID